MVPQTLTVLLLLCLFSIPTADPSRITSDPSASLKLSFQRKFLRATGLIKEEDDHTEFARIASIVTNEGIADDRLLAALTEEILKDSSYGFHVSGGPSHRPSPSDDGSQLAKFTTSARVMVAMLFAQGVTLVDTTKQIFRNAANGGDVNALVDAQHCVGYTQLSNTAKQQTSERGCPRNTRNGWQLERILCKRSV